MLFYTEIFRKLIRRIRTYMCYLVSVFVLLLNVPVYFEGKITTCFNPETNTTLFLWSKTAFRENRAYILYYRTLILGLLFTSLGPLVVIVGLSAATVTRIYKSYRVRLSMQQTFSHDRVFRRHCGVMQVCMLWGWGNYVNVRFPFNFPVIFRFL